ncbi:hypothetical protein BaRGS_00040164, partial [Batillaria attramentaria]
ARSRSDLGHQSRKRYRRYTEASSKWGKNNLTFSEVLHLYAAENASEFQSGIWRAVSRQRQTTRDVLSSKSGARVRLSAVTRPTSPSQRLYPLTSAGSDWLSTSACFLRRCSETVSVLGVNKSDNTRSAEKAVWVGRPEFGIVFTEKAVWVGRPEFGIVFTEKAVWVGRPEFGIVFTEKAVWVGRPEFGIVFTEKAVWVGRPEFGIVFTEKAVWVGRPEFGIVFTEKAVWGWKTRVRDSFYREGCVGWKTRVRDSF